jgi:hypothetical protein
MKKAVEVDDALESDGGAKLRYASATSLIRNIPSASRILHTGALSEGK